MFDTGPLTAVLTGIQSQQPQPVPAPAPATSTGPLANLQAILTGSADYGNILQKIGGGMANMSNAGGDPYLAFAQGFGGSQNFTAEQQKAALARADALAKQQQDANLALQRLTQDQSQFDARMGQDQSQFDTRMSHDSSQFAQRVELDKAAEKRTQQIADDNRRKTDAELLRMAKKEGLSVDQMLSIERIAQAEAENEVDPQRRRAITDATRERLTKMAKSGNLSDGPGVTESETTPTTATGPNGEKLVLQGGQWVPMQTP